jgi:tRNA-dihydrouridine synthase
VTIHLKHAQESSSEEYDYLLLDELASYNLPLVVNGGIRNSEDIKKLMKSVSPENRKNIKGVMLGRKALKNPDCFSEISNSFNGSQFAGRNLGQIKAEFNELCKQHMPKAIYIKTIKEKCSWAV